MTGGTHLPVIVVAAITTAWQTNATGQVASFVRVLRACMQQQICSRSSGRCACRSIVCLAVFVHTVAVACSLQNTNISAVYTACVHMPVISVALSPVWKWLESNKSSRLRAGMRQHQLLHVKALCHDYGMAQSHIMLHHANSPASPASLCLMHSTLLAISQMPAGYQINCQGAWIMYVIMQFRASS